jgi:hypothetical protein
MPVIAHRAQRSPRRAGLALTATLLTLAAALPTTASADTVSTQMHVAVNGSAELVNGVYLAVPVDVTCPVLQPPFSAIFSDNISLQVNQKAGREIAFGFAQVSYQSPIFNGVGVGTPVTCDGTVHTVTLNAFPVPQSGPFHGGNAVASITFGLGLYDPSNPGFFNIDQNTTASGPQPIKIHG